MKKKRENQNTKAKALNGNKAWTTMHSQTINLSIFVIK
jgi:hypothetical protein